MGNRTKPKRIGYVAAKMLAPGKWELRWHDGVAGDRRRRIGTANYDDVKAVCSEINKAILERRGFLPQIPDGPPEKEVTISAALLQAVKATAANPETRRKYKHAVNRFLRYLKENYAEVAHWSDLKPSILIAYKNSLRGAYDTKRNLLVPIKRASAYWAADAPEKYRDYCAAAKGQLKLRRIKRTEIPALSKSQLRNFLAFMCKHYPELYPLACLQGLAGARGYEAAHVRVSDFNSMAGEITFTDTAAHKLKTPASERTIPLIPQVLEAVLGYRAKLESREPTPDAPLFLNKDAMPWTPNRLSYAWRVAMTAARKEQGLKLPVRFSGDHLRHTFTTLAYEAGCRERTLQRYLGHAAPDVMGQHYLHISVSQLRQQVVVPFDRCWMKLSMET